MLLDDIADYLSSGGVTATLYKGYLPDVPDSATALYETGGAGPVHAMGNVAGAAKVEQPRVQVVCRAAASQYATARATAHQIWKLLDQLPARDINGVSYKWGAAVQSPFMFGRDASLRVLIACNYDIVKEPTP